MSGLRLDVEPFLEFLGAQLDEDERMATNDGRLRGDVWTALERNPSQVTWDIIGTGGEIASALGWEARHIARHDPARVLREVDGIRQIIHKAVQYQQDGASPGGNVFGYHATGMFTALRHIAEARYADRPGYRDRWRP